MSEEVVVGSGVAEAEVITIWAVAEDWDSRREEEGKIKFKINIKIKVKGNGQECPFHTSKFHTSVFHTGRGAA